MFFIGDFNGNIQQAIDVAHDVGGGTVCVPSGVWQQPIMLRSRVKLIGAGTLKAAGVSKLITIEPGSLDWSMEGLFIDGSGLILGDDGRGYCIFEASGSLSKGGMLRGLTFMNIPTGLGQVTHAVELNSASASVLDCRVRGCGGDAIAVNVGTYVVSGNIVEESGDGGIAINNAASGSFTGNILSHCDLGIGSGAAGTLAAPHSSTQIIGNKIEDCGDGINMGWFGLAGRASPKNVAISANNILRSTRTGIRYDGPSVGFSGGLSLTGNTIAEGANGIVLSSVDDVALSGNVVVDNSGKGLSCASPVRRVSASANIIRRNAVGADFSNADDWVWGDNIVQGNSADMVGSPST